MTQSFKNVPPPNQSRIEREFYDFIQRPELRGFNSRLADEFGHESDSHVSRMHSPHVPETRSWLYELAGQLDKACRANLGVGRKALSILSAVVVRHASASEPLCDDALDAAWYQFKSFKASFNAGLCSADEYDAARNHLVETLGRIQTGARVMTAGEVARDVNQNSGR